MIGSETASAKFFARVKSSDADVPRTIPASCSKSVAGSCRRMLCLNNSVWESVRSGKGRRRVPLEAF